MTKQVLSKIFCPASGTWTFNYTDGSTAAMAGDIFTEFESENAFIGAEMATYDSFHESANLELQAKRKAEGRCVSCGAVREMSVHGLRDCEICY